MKPAMKAPPQTQNAAPDGQDTELVRPELELTILIGESARLMRTAFDARMRSIGLTGASSRALFILFKEDGLSQIELARRLDVSRMALGQTIDRLEKSGHVERRPDPSDRRVWRLFATPLAHTLRKTITDIAAEQQNLFLAGLSNAEVDALKNSLHRVMDSLKSMPMGSLAEDDASSEPSDAQ